MRRLSAAALPLLAVLSMSCGEPVAPDPGEPVSLHLLRGAGQTGRAGEPLDSAVVVRVQDARGTGVPGVPVRFVVTAGGGRLQPEQVLSAADGTAQVTWVLGDLVHTDQRATAMVLRPGAAPIETAFTATALPTGPVAAVRSIAPAVLSPGSTATITGDSLHHVTAVSVAGLPAMILTRSATTLDIRIPAAGYDCAPTDDVPVVLTAASGRVQELHPLRVAAARQIEVGAALVSSPADPLACVELPAEGGRYIITVANVSDDTTSQAGVRLRGLSSADAPVARLSTSASTSASAVRGSAEPRAPIGSPLHRQRSMPLGQHATLHQHRLGSATALRATPPSTPSARSSLADDVQPGDTITIRFPRLSTSTTVCSGYDPVVARVVHVRQRVIVLEDVLHPLPGTLAEDYRRFAEQYEAVQYPILTEHFAAAPGTDQRLLMLFTPRVNALGLAGLVSAGDLMPRASCAQSNEAPVFYGYVPTVAGDEYGPGTVAEWRWTVPSTLMHEAKHLTSISARLAAGLPAQEPWLEEATAMIAEELWARRVFGYDQRGNVEFAASLGCEIAGAFDREPCAGMPAGVLAHFHFLAGWMTQPSTSSLLGPVTRSDVTWYGSSWLFLRWLLDHADASEAARLRQITTSQQTGMDAVESIFGRPFAQLLPEWATAVAVDDRATATVPAPYTIPSWDLRDIYIGLNREQPNLFPTTFPLRVRTLAYGNTQTDVPVVRAGGAAYFDLTGEPAGRQALSFSGARGTSLPAVLRITIVRIE